MLNTLLMFSHSPSQYTFEIAAVTVLILKMRELRFRDVKKLTKGDTADPVICINMLLML